MVFRRRFNAGIRPVNRIKHVIDQQNALAAGTSATDVLAIADDNPALANTTEVQTGAKVNGIFLSLEATRTGTTSDVLANVYMMVYKNQGGNNPPPNPNVVGASDSKRFGIHQEMVMLQGTNAGNPRTVFKGVIALPRGYRRFGPGDILQLKVQSPGVAINYCFQCHYKEFR